MRAYYTNPRFVAQRLASEARAMTQKNIEDESQQSNDKPSGTKETPTQPSVVDEKSDE
jgi:hypothetical protein